MSGARPGAHLVFHAGGTRFAIPVDRIQGAARARQIVPLPGAPPEYAGIAFVRGEPVGVLDAARALGAQTPASPAAEGAERFLVILEGERHALLVDRIEEVVEQPAGAGSDPALRIVSIDEVLGGGVR
jgi:chemotaxis signal transduction protein